ncbi:hypothetical protein [Aureimonas populi]|uniref:3-keto-disaccharide hydrolase domain-containing protein n=2 Tax=Aureimonas populi TaxID=1701758 RepID=A0ABW5CQ44_9HYPH
MEDYRLRGVTAAQATYLGSEALEVRMSPADWQDPAREALSDRDFMAWLPVDFHDGTIEAEVASVLAPGAPDYARGFIGLAFRITPDGRFESIYLRPVNSLVDDPVRRNRSVQYVAYPDFRFDRLREEAPGRYETHADLALERWIAMRILVKGARAELYLDGAPEPTLVVPDLKHGADLRGGVGLWLESGTIAYFRNLRIDTRD